MAFVALVLAGALSVTDAGVVAVRAHQSSSIPDLTGLDGRPIRMADLRGRVVLVDIWATWCAPCLADLPKLRRLQHSAGDDLVIVGVSLDRMSRRDFISWIRRHDVTWPQHFDGRGWGSPVARALGVEALPETYVIDRAGRVVARNVRGDALAAVVTALLDRPRPHSPPCGAAFSQSTR
jgi:thiol-disulfide isomerase/thioredoxin